MKTPLVGNERKIRIRVRSTGSDNRARVLQTRCKASCTASAEMAAKGAAAKFFGEKPFTLRLVQIGDVATRKPDEFVAVLKGGA